jgi:hypothetical protein
MGQRNFLITYEHCGTTWTDEWSCACDDECPVCGADIEASDWRQLAGTWRIVLPDGSTQDLDVEGEDVSMEDALAKITEPFVDAYELDEDGSRI